MEDYLKLMMREQAEARKTYTYDPRERLLTQPFSTGTIETFNGSKPTNLESVDYTGIPEGSRSDPSIVQDTPKTRTMKKYVIMDASQRDWVKQPNPYSNLVSVLSSSPIASTTSPETSPATRCSCTLSRKAHGRAECCPTPHGHRLIWTQFTLA